MINDTSEANAIQSGHQARKAYAKPELKELPIASNVRTAACVQFDPATCTSYQS